MFGGFLLLGGRAADLVGRRRLFMGGLVVFSAASLLAALAWNEPSLIGARALQGLGAAIIAPAALSIVMTTFPRARSATSRSASGEPVGGFGAAAGVLMGGIFTDAQLGVDLLHQHPGRPHGDRAGARPAHREP